MLVFDVIDGFVQIDCLGCIIEEADLMIAMHKTA
jgi:hypothetical protein